MNISDIAVTSFSVVLSAIVALVISRHYYYKTRHDLDAQQSSLESLGENTFRAIKAANPDKSGDVFKALNGKWAQK